MGISAAMGTGGLTPGVVTSTTRPSAPFEGQLIYETDTDLLRIYNGSSWRTLAFSTPSSGSVLQVATATYSTQLSTSSTSYVDTNLTVSITPTSTSSKILLIANQTGLGKAAGGGGGYRLALQLVRGSTSISVFEVGAAYDGGAGVNVCGDSSVVYLDSPSSTSSVTYKTQIKGFDGGTVYAQYDNSTSTIAALEIAG